MIINDLSWFEIKRKERKLSKSAGKGWNLKYL
jgi:hypothetical protein